MITALLLTLLAGDCDPYTPPPTIPIKVTGL